MMRSVLQGYWSRRITSEHRIVYKKTGDQILIRSCATIIDKALNKIAKRRRL